MKTQSERIALANDGDIGLLSSAVYNPPNSFHADRALISVFAYGMFRVDGINPSATEGHPVSNGSTIILDSPEEIDRFRIMQNGSEALALFVTYFFEASK